MMRLLLMSRRIEVEKRMVESSRLMEISCRKVLTLKFVDDGRKSTGNLNIFIDLPQGLAICLRVSDKLASHNTLMDGKYRMKHFQK